MFVDAGWFLDIAPYASRTDGFTFQKTAKALAGSLNATFDRCCALLTPCKLQAISRDLH